MSLTTGQILQNRYRIVVLLGQGGMGAVYRGWHLGLEMPVAIKEMVPQPGLNAEELNRLRDQFRQEAAVLARLKHLHLVTVTDYFIEQGNTYLVMEFVAGESLAARIERRGALPEAEVLGCAAHLLDALGYCHRQHVIHRDVKPQNIIMKPSGDAVLVDFGLVKLWDPADPRTKTAIRGAGTPEYSPPEQYGGHNQHTGPHSDLYSVGATLYHALTGLVPPSPTERIVNPGVLRPPAAMRGDVSPRTEAAIMRALALRPEQRFVGAEAMSEALAPRPIQQVHVPSSPPAVAPTVMAPSPVMAAAPSATPSFPGKPAPPFQGPPPASRPAPSPSSSAAVSRKSPFIAAVLSFLFLGGAGQMYLGQWVKGIIIIAVHIPLMLFGIGFFTIPLVVGDAYGVAKKVKQGMPVGEWEFRIHWKVVGLVALVYVSIVVAYAIVAVIIAELSF
jgi:eukaryotic-like serine/threonine-protein kinase